MENQEGLTTGEQVLLGLNNTEIDIDDFDFDDETSDEELSALDRRLNRYLHFRNKKGKKMRLSKKEVKRETGASKSRLQVLDRVQTLPKSEQKALMNHRKQIVDKSIYSVVDVGLVDRLIPGDGGKSVGERSFSNGKYDHWFLIQGIQILYEPSNIPAAYLTSLWNTALPGEIINGELSLKVDSKTIQDDYPLISVPNYVETKRELNTIKLKNPKWLAPGKTIEASLKLSATLTDGFVKIVFIGHEIRPY